MNENRANAKTIFLQAVEIVRREDRQAYLTAACGDDESLRDEVEDLLQHQKRLGSFLESVPGGPATAESTADATGTVIGPYKLLHKLGEGGMGAVYLAEQTHPVQRHVALKVIKSGMDTRHVIARFEMERQALAIMDHVNIARVFDAGTTETGRPYFVMELVHGVPITKYCDDNLLTPRERLELFVPVCQAIQHAHQKGIIHRDVKPSNVMVTLCDNKPVPKVIDFGVAKAIEQELTEGSRFTQYGMMVGTLEYMSPEQAEMSALGIDTRSDIYSLGVLLYELLAGSTPLSHQRIKEAAFAEILRMIKEEEPPRPSARLSDSGEALASISAQRRMEPAKLTKLMRGELDWILMKTLEKERKRRYETVNDFAADIQRFLNDEPVQACPPSVRYRLGKFARRSRGAVIAAGLVSFTLLAGIVGTTLGLVQARREEANAIGERNQKQTALDNLVTEQQKTKKALEAQTRARDQTHSALRTLADDLVAGVLAQQRPLSGTEKAYLGKVVRFIEKLGGEYGDTPEAWKIQGDGYWLVGQIQAVLGNTKEAETAHRKALAIRMRLLADSPDDIAYRRVIAVSHVELGRQVARAGHMQEAENSYREAIATLTRLAPGPSDKLSDLYGLAESHNLLGLLLTTTGRFPEAEASFREVVAMGKSRPTPVPGKAAADEPLFWAVVANSYDNLAIVLARTGRPKEAESACAEAQAIRQKLPADPENQRDAATSQMNVGATFFETGRVPQAEAAFRGSMAIMRKLVADFPLKPQNRERLATVLENLGTLLTQTGRAEQAEEIHREALTLLRQLTADFPDDSNYRHGLADAQFNLGQVFQKTGRPREAEEAYREALGHQKQLAAAFPEKPSFTQALSRTHGNLGNLLFDQHRNQDAESAYREALALDTRLAEDFPTVTDYKTVFGGSCCNLGNLFQFTSRAAEAVAWYDRAIGALEPVLAKHPQLVKARKFLRNSHWGRADTLGKLNRHADALKDWEIAIDLSPPPQRASVKMGRAACLARAGQSIKATQAAEALLTAPKVPGDLLYDAACVFALSAAAVKDDGNVRERYAVRAVEILAKAQAAGFFRRPGKIEHMKQDSDLVGLHGRADYQKLRRALEGENKP